jgi:hypothetical protein
MYPKLKQEDFIKAYKVSFICGCINAGTKGAFQKFMLDNNDLALFSEVELVSHDVVLEADSIGRIYANRIGPINYSDAGNRVPYVSSCIYYSMSRQVDSLARISFKRFKKAKLEYDYEN